MKGLDVFEKLLRVLADEGLGVVAGDVMPLDPIIIDVVQNSHAGLHWAVDIELRDVKLGHVVGDQLSLIDGEGLGPVAPALPCHTSDSSSAWFYKESIAMAKGQDRVGPGWACRIS